MVNKKKKKKKKKKDYGRKKLYTETGQKRDEHKLQMATLVVHCDKLSPISYNENQDTETTRAPM